MLDTLTVSGLKTVKNDIFCELPDHFDRGRLQLNSRYIEVSKSTMSNTRHRSIRCLVHPTKFDIENLTSNADKLTRLKSII